jgi:hypothetical protein
MKESSPVTLSVHIYKLLLTAYPSEFRREYGPHMLQLFRDCSLRVYKQSGPTGMFSLWTVTLFDFFSTVVEEHLHRETNMTKEKFIRLSGWALVLAAVTLVAGFGIGGGETSYSDPLGGRDGFYEYGQLILVPASMLLFTIGMIGLRARFGPGSGRLGNIGLVIAIAGGAAAFLTSIPLFALWVVYEGMWWTIWISSMLALFTGLFLFGIDAIRKKPMPRWNAVPLLTGIWFPILGLMAILLNLLGVDTTSSGNGDFLWIFSLIFVVIGTMVLGYLLQSDVPEKPIPAT